MLRVALVHWCGLVAGVGVGRFGRGCFCRSSGRDLGAGFCAVTWCFFWNRDRPDILTLLSDLPVWCHCVLVSPGRFCLATCGPYGACLIALDQCSIVTAGSCTFCPATCGRHGLYLCSVCDRAQPVTAPECWATCGNRPCSPGSLRSPWSTSAWRPPDTRNPLPGVWSRVGGSWSPPEAL